MPLGEGARRALETFRAVRTVQDEAGAAAACTYIVSMTTEPEDLLRVLLLAREAGLVDLAADVPESRLDVVPLFETLDDLVAFIAAKVSENDPGYDPTWVGGVSSATGQAFVRRLWPNVVDAMPPQRER